MIYTNFEQRSPEWLQMRTGCLTASRMYDALNKPGPKSRTPFKELECRKRYKRELAIERITGDVTDHYVSPYMKTALFQHEPIARAEYEFRTRREVKQIGLAVHDSITWFCASPDGLVGDTGCQEIKCLYPQNHFDILESGVIPEEYQYQMDAQLMCTGRTWCDFVSYCPLKNLPEHLQLCIIRYVPEPAVLRGRELEVEQFLKEVAEMTQRLTKGEYAALQEAAR